MLNLKRQFLNLSGSQGVLDKRSICMLYAYPTALPQVTTQPDSEETEFHHVSTSLGERGSISPPKVRHYLYLPV